MIRINAYRVHAEVIECVTRWDGPAMELKAESMGEGLAPNAVDLAVKIPVPVAADGTNPNPASRPRADLRFESGSLVLGSWSLCHKYDDTTRDTEYIGSQLFAHLAEVAA